MSDVRSESNPPSAPEGSSAFDGGPGAKPVHGEEHGAGPGAPTLSDAGRSEPAERPQAGADEARKAPESAEEDAPMPGPAAEPEAGPLLPYRVRHAIVAWLGAFVVIGGTWRLFDAQHLHFAFASLGGSAVILFSMPESRMAQPRSLFGGHAIASLVGLLAYGWFGTNTWSLAVAVATALVAMQLTGTTHSPAGADPIIIMTSAVSGPMVMLNLSVGLLLLWLIAVVLLNGMRINPYCRDVHVGMLQFLGRATRRLRRDPRRREG